jgi:P4 family phage/plasmid primase-like protien
MDSDYINCKNGLLNWRTLELVPHRADIYVPNQIPVEWNPEATCPEYDKWLSQVVEEDSVALMHEVHGYALINDNPLHKAVMLYGSGRNGKGTELRLMRKLLGGRENISSVSPQELDGDRFAIVETYRKLANIVGDVDARMFEGTEVFKKMTGQDFIRGQRKNGQPFDFMCRALMVASFNEFPRTSDHTEGFWSRWIVIAFCKGYFPDSIKDPEVESRISSETELQGVLVKAVMGLRRVIGASAFSVGDSSKKASEEFQKESDLLHLFMEDVITIEPEAKGLLRRTAIKEGFTKWLESNGHRRQSMSKREFWARWRKALEQIHKMSPEIIAARESSRNGYLGITMHIDPLTGMILEPEEPDPDSDSEKAGGVKRKG